MFQHHDHPLLPPPFHGHAAATGQQADLSRPSVLSATEYLSARVGGGCARDGNDGRAGLDPGIEWPPVLEALDLRPMGQG